MLQNCGTAGAKAGDAMPRYTLCPYYVDENKKTISCEDVIRRFATYRSKNRHMDKYCDKDWKDCPYADALSRMYQRIDDGADEDREIMTHNLMALEKENKKMLSLLGRYDIRLIAKDKEIRQVRKRAAELEDALHKEHRKRKEAERRNDGRLHQQTGGD